MGIPNNIIFYSIILYIPIGGVSLTSGGRITLLVGLQHLIQIILFISCPSSTISGLGLQHLIHASGYSGFLLCFSSSSSIFSKIISGTIIYFFTYSSYHTLEHIRISLYLDIIFY